MLQTSTVKKSTFGLLKRLQAEPLLATTRLVGGTALSLQIGHRESDDLDLFSAEPLEGMLAQSLLVDKYGFLPSVVSDNTLIGFVDGVKIDVIYHPFPWMDPAIIEEMLIPEIRMLGYVFDFQSVEKRIIKMTDYPDKVYATAPLNRM